MKYRVKTENGYVEDKVLKDHAQFYAKQEKNETKDIEDEVVVFCLNKEWFSLSTKDVQKITLLNNITIVPRSKSILIGLANIDGNFLPVIDICQLLKIKSIQIQNISQVKLFVLESPLFPFCFLVEEVFGIAKIDKKQMFSLDNFSDNTIVNKASKVLVYNTWQQVFLIKLQNLCSALDDNF